MKRRTIKCDVLVVGGGPAGSMAAQTVARHGLRVLLVDKKKRIGERPHCGEFIPEKLMNEFDLSWKIVDQKVDAMETMIIEGTLPDQRALGTAMFAKKKVRSQTRKSDECDYESVNTPSAGYTIDRSALDLGLAKRAASNGAVILNDSKLVKFNHQRSLVIRQREEIVIDSKVTIAADGANSAISSALGYPNPKFLLGVQCQVPLAQALQRTIVFFHKSITYGYGWIFPKGNSANFGIGMFPQKKALPNALLGKFLDLFINRGVLKQGIFSRSKGLIPVTGVREKLVEGNVAFVGDAGGLTHCITGAGVPQAMISGEMAGVAAVNSIKQGRIELLGEYEAQIRGLYSGILNHAFAKRILMRKLWESRDLKFICEHTWIAFRGYRRRVREN